MSQTAIPLVAAGLDWLEGLLPLLFVVIWIASQVLNLFRGAKRPEAQPQRQPARPVRPAAGDPRLDTDLTREIEAFLQGRGDGEQERRRPRESTGSPKPPRRRSRRATEAEPPPLPVATQQTVRQQAVRQQSAATEDIASHVATAFAHDLAHESPDGTVMADAPRVALSEAEELALALRAPGGLRRFLLMQEVLTRPTHRW